MDQRATPQQFATPAGLERMAACAIDKQVRAERILVTRAMAKNWLERNDGNRKPNKAHIAYLRQIIEEGGWDNGHPQGVVFSSGWRLIDGQHRLMALVDSVSPQDGIVMWVICGVSEETQKTIDTGVTRKAEVRFGCAKRVAELVNFIARARDFTPRPTPTQFSEIMKTYDAGLDWCADWPTKIGTCRTPIVVAVMLLWYQDKDAAESFRKTLTVDSCTECQPAYMLRMLVHRAMLAKKIPQNNDLFRLAKGATRAALQRREVKVLKPMEGKLW
jgi:hypothetical protein